MLSPTDSSGSRRGRIEETPSLAMQLGTAIGLATLASLACALPATLRIADVIMGGATAGRVWTALAASALVPMIAAVAVLRGAADGVRALLAPGARWRAFGVALWLASLFVMLTVLGGFLRATTHHHALAGVTYAFAALGLAVGSALVWMRVIAILRAASYEMQHAGAAFLAAMSVAALGWVALRFAGAVAHERGSSAAVATVLDVVAFAAAAFLGSGRGLASNRAIALFGPTVALVVVVLGITTLRDAPLREVMNTHAPVFASAASAAGLVSGH
ncbi:MAG: hypothetical protein M3O36_09100 [Myxococcota bacterium]|nr:hypothetical protein [Myxococcota bacterium]